MDCILLKQYVFSKCLNIFIGTLFFGHTNERKSVADPGFDVQRLTQHFIYNNKALASNSMFAMFNVFNITSWLTIGIFAIFMISVMTLYGEKFNFSMLVWSMTSIGQAYSAQSFDIRLFNKNLKLSKYLLIFSISFFGGFFYWYFTGILLSFLAVPSKDPPMRSLDDLLTKTDFKLHVGENWFQATTINKWANQNQRNMEAYKKFVVPNFVTIGLEDMAKLISQDENPNQALILDAKEFDQLGQYFCSTFTLYYSTLYFLFL